jgi:primosomal protein N' (replication factor Y)
VFFSGRDEAAVESAAAAAADSLRPEADERGIQVLGPAPQALARLRGQHRWHVLIKGVRASAVREAAERSLAAAESGAVRASVRVVADVDPVEVL